MCRSVPQIPPNPQATVSPPGTGGGTGKASITGGRPNSFSTAARLVRALMPFPGCAAGACPAHEVLGTGRARGVLWTSL